MFDKSQAHIASSIVNYEWKMETCVADKKVMICSVTKKSVKRVCYSLKSHAKTLLEVSGREENEKEETFERKLEKE